MPTEKMYEIQDSVGSNSALKDTALLATLWDTTLRPVNHSF